MKPEECIFFLLAKASQRGQRYWSQAVSGLGVTAVQAMILDFLSDEDQITSHKLGQKCDLDSATLTGILDRLEAGGFLRRRPNQSDRRSILISLTEKGSGTARQIKMLMKQADAGFLGRLSDDEKANLKCLLTRIRTEGIQIGLVADK